MLPPLPRFIPPLGPGKLGARERILAQWRGVNVTALEKARQTSRPLADIMPRVLSDMRIDRRQSEAEVIKVWNSLLDPSIVAHAQPTGLRNRTLFVTVDSPAWHCEIVRYRRREILTRLQHSFGQDFIAKISFRIG